MDSNLIVRLTLPIGNGTHVESCRAKGTDAASRQKRHVTTIGLAFSNHRGKLWKDCGKEYGEQVAGSDWKEEGRNSYGCEKQRMVHPPPGFSLRLVLRACVDKNLTLNYFLFEDAEVAELTRVSNSQWLGKIATGSIIDLQNKTFFFCSIFVFILLT